MICRVCGDATVEVYARAAPAVTSTGTTLDAPTRVRLCPACGHAQSDDLDDVQRFYDVEYRISAASDDHDQLYEVVDGVPVYRTDKQARIALDLLQLPPGATLLDFGCAKAVTLRKICAARPDVVPFAFDVSDAYRPYWDPWLSPERSATHELPDAWTGRFDALTAHFVLEHVVDPVALLRRMRRLLKASGRLFVSVPDVVQNPGDMVVVDHLNHFSAGSFAHALQRAGFAIEHFDRAVFGAAHVVVARLGEAHAPGPATRDEVAAVRSIAEFWQAAAARLEAFASRSSTGPVAIFGAGFYGVWIASVLAGRVPVVCFVDNNPHVQGTTPLGVPVLAPKDLPADVRTLCVGLNPLRARTIVADSTVFANRGLDFVFLD